MSKQPTTEPGSDEWRGMTPRGRGLTEPMIDEVFGLLADWRRRAVCRYFVESTTSTAEVNTIATAVAQRGMGRAGITDTEMSAVREALVEEHLPHLDRAGVLDFDERSESVRYWGQPTVEKWVEHADELSR